MAANVALTIQDKELVSTTRNRDAQVRELAALMTTYKTAQERLADFPEDRDANLAIGAWRCFHDNDWDTGLPLLAKGSDPRLKSIAEMELAVSSDAADQVKLADTWFVYAQEDSDGDNANAIRRRALHWYTSAHPNLTGLNKIAVEKKLDELRPLVATLNETASNSGTSPEDTREFLKDFVFRFTVELEKVAALATSVQRAAEHKKVVDRFDAEMKRHILVFRFPIEDVQRESSKRGYSLEFGLPAQLEGIPWVRRLGGIREVDLHQSKVVSLDSGWDYEIRGRGRLSGTVQRASKVRGAKWMFTIKQQVFQGEYNVFLTNFKGYIKRVESTDDNP